MWVSTEVDNAAAHATYRRAGATEETSFVLLNWDLTEGASRHDGGGVRTRSEGGQT
jgi:hypothetical protein